jgi:hypothetical protein
MKSQWVNSRTISNTTRKRERSWRRILCHWIYTLFTSWEPALYVILSEEGVVLFSCVISCYFLVHSYFNFFFYFCSYLRIVLFSISEIFRCSRYLLFCFSLCWFCSYWISTLAMAIIGRLCRLGLTPRTPACISPLATRCKPRPRALALRWVTTSILTIRLLLWVATICSSPVVP